jgi:hypothetical protein
MTEPQQLRITLNASGVTGPALRAIQQSVETMSFYLAAIESGDLSAPPHFDNSRFHLRFSGEMSPEQRKAMYTNWLLSKGFQELARGVREMLEEAFFYNSMIQTAEGLKTWGEFQGQMQEVRKRAGRASFPDLMRWVNSGLTSPLHFEREFLSLQKVRNCLEHRNGVVSEIDTHEETKTLRLALPRLKMFVMQGGAEIELQIGHHVEADTRIGIRNVTDEWEFKLGERVTFNSEEFHDIGFGCWAFTSDLGSKLPKLPEVAHDT